MSSKILSLYDYLGEPAGSKLGKQVAESAASMGIKVQIKSITNPKYSGKICMYPETFLDLYFNKLSLERKVSELQDNTLPF